MLFILNNDLHIFPVEQCSIVQDNIHQPCSKLGSTDYLLIRLVTLVQRSRQSTDRGTNTCLQFTQEGHGQVKACAAQSTNLQKNVPRSQSLFYIVPQGSLSTPSPDNIMCNKWGRERGADVAASHPSVGFPPTYSPHSLLGQSSNPCCDTTGATRRSTVDFLKLSN